MQPKKKISARELVLVALFAALLAALSQLSIPLPSGVPLTMQTFAVALCGFTLGAKRAPQAVLVYLLMGAVGLPVFAGLMGGAGVLVGVTGGFLWGFLAMAALCGTRKPAFAAAGLAVCHALGVLQFNLVTQTPPAAAFALVSAPYLIKDAISVTAAYFASAAVRRGLQAARFSFK